MSSRARIERLAARAFLRLPAALRRALVGPPRRSRDGHVLDPETQALVWLMQRRNGPDLHTGGPERARRLLDHTGSLLAGRVEGVGARDLHVPGATGPLRARLYTPREAPARGAPGLVWFHGGGFALGSIASHDGVCRQLADASGVAIVSVEYRLAPEHPFPAAVDDAVAASRAVIGDAEAYGLDARRVAVGGDSAGGNLAAVAAQALRASAPRPAFQLLVYPVTDFTRSCASREEFREGFTLTRESIDWFDACYLPSGENKTDPRVSCLFATDLSGLPPAMVVTAGFDPLRDEGRAYADRMRAAGCSVEYLCAEGLVHGFLHMAGLVREPTRVFGLLADGLRRGLAAR